MIVEAAVTIAGSRTAVWAVMTDIEHAAATFSGIEQVEIVDRPMAGLAGLRWRETRLLFGKPATVEKWITEAVEPESCRTRAESDGFVFVTTKRLVEHDGVVTLTEAHESRPQTFLARLQMIPMGLFFRGAIRTAILQDLNDVKASVERQATQ